MSYFSSSNYEQYYDNYQFYQPYYNYDHHHDHDHGSRYVQYGHNDHTQYYNNEFQVAPSQSLVGYYCFNNNNNNEIFASKNANFHENGDYYYDPVSTQYVISYNNISEKEANDLVFEEYNPEPFHGGYDINETYGQALPPSNDICYPPTKINPNLTVSLPYGNNVDPKPEPNFIPSNEDEHYEDEEGDEEDNVFDSDEDEDEVKPKSNLVLVENVNDSNEDKDEDENEDQDEVKPKSNLVLEENVIDSEEDEDEDEDEDEEDEDEDDESEVMMQTLEGEREETISSKLENERGEGGGNRGNGNGNGKEMRRQIAYGSGMEAVDICDGLFGGYFPCLLKKNKGGSCKQCGGSGVKLRNMDDYECWQGTVDYFFGNPNPYGGSMPEKGSYGDPMLCYRRYYPQEAIVGEVKYEENENSSWLHDYSRYNYGYN